MHVTVQDNNVDKALKALKRQLQKQGHLKDMKKKSFYEKPSEKRKRKQQEAKRNRRKSLKARVS